MDPHWCALAQHAKQPGRETTLGPRFCAGDLFFDGMMAPPQGRHAEQAEFARLVSSVVRDHHCLHVGGIFFDDMMDRPQEQLLAFSGDCMKAVGQSYLPIVAKRHEQSFTDEHKAWQQLRRGRYVEFNLASPLFTRLKGLDSGSQCCVHAV